MDTLVVLTKPLVLKPKHKPTKIQTESSATSETPTNHCTSATNINFTDLYNKYIENQRWRDNLQYNTPVSWSAVSLALSCRHNDDSNVRKKSSESIVTCYGHSGHAVPACKLKQRMAPIPQYYNALLPTQSRVKTPNVEVMLELDY